LRNVGKRRYMVAECPSCGQYFSAPLSKKPSCPRCGERLNPQSMEKDVVGSWKTAARLVQRKQAEKAGKKYSEAGMLTKSERFETVIRSFQEGVVVSVEDIVRRAENFGLREEWVLKRLDYMEREGLLIRKFGGVRFVHPRT